MSQKDFNLDMESYLSKRKGAFYFEPSKKKVRPKKMAETAEDFPEGEHLMEKAEETPAPEYKESEKPKSIFSALRSWLNFSSDIEDEYVQSPTEEDSMKVSDDIKEVLKILNRWIAKLPSKTIKEFKESEDYRFYKDILKKYKLIKE